MGEKNKDFAFLFLNSINFSIHQSNFNFQLSYDESQSEKKIIKITKPEDEEEGASL